LIEVETEVVNVNVTVDIVDDDDDRNNKKEDIAAATYSILIQSMTTSVATLPSQELTSLVSHLETPRSPVL
jgi:cell division septation protein DedD